MKKVIRLLQLPRVLAKDSYCTTGISLDGEVVEPEHDPVAGLDINVPITSVRFVRRRTSVFRWPIRRRYLSRVLVRDVSSAT